VTVAGTGGEKIQSRTDFVEGYGTRELKGTEGTLGGRPLRGGRVQNPDQKKGVGRYGHYKKRGVEDPRRSRNNGKENVNNPGKLSEPWGRKRKSNA